MFDSILFSTDLVQKYLFINVPINETSILLRNFSTSDSSIFHLKSAPC